MLWFLQLKSCLQNILKFFTYILWRIWNMLHLFLYHHQSMIQNSKCLFKQVPISCVVLDDDLPTDLHKEKQAWTEIPINNFTSCASSSLILYSFYSYSFQSWWGSLILAGRKLWLMRRNPFKKNQNWKLVCNVIIKITTSICTQVAEWAHPFTFML